MAADRRRSRAKAVKRAPARAENPERALAAGFDLAEIERLVDLVQRTGIGELELSASGRSVRISASPGGALTWAAAPPPPAPAVARPAGDGAGSAPAGEPASSGSAFQAVTSPMVGTFYRAPAPDADPFVEVGDIIEVGQTVCIIEAMKLMNEIEAEVKGRVVQILVDNAQPVEFGQKLFLVEPV